MSDTHVSISEANPAPCTPEHECEHHDAEHAHGPDCGHVDYVVGGHLHHPHGDHCDHHGSVQEA